VEENHRRNALKPGPVLGLAGVTTLAGVMLVALAIHRVSHSVWSKATMAFLMGVVALIISGRLYAAWLSLRQGGGDRGRGS
jgi:cytochrome c oxidase assembly factor CtaG